MINHSKGGNNSLPGFLEYGYYFSIIYMIMGPALGLSAEFLGVGILSVLTILCILLLGSRALTVYAPIVFPLACGFSFVVLQVLLHDESLLGDTRAFVPWMLALILVQSLAQRQGFLHRFALATLMIGLMLLPYLKLDYGGDAQLSRAGLDRQVGLNNPNDLAAWFGFCAVYFFVASIETKRNVMRVIFWLVVIGSLYIIGITVSRGTLFAVAIAGIVAFRRTLKRGFAPVLLLVVLLFIIYNLGLFDQITASYIARNTEETGRFLVWPLAAERFLSSPLIGVGISNIGTYVPLKGKLISPHNSFLFIALASGIFPLVFFVAYWWRAISSTLKSLAEEPSDTPFRLPLLIYAFTVAQDLNMPFALPWMIVTLSFAMAPGVQRRIPHTAVRRGMVKKERSVQQVAPLSSIGTGLSTSGRVHRRNSSKSTSNHSEAKQSSTRLDIGGIERR